MNFTFYIISITTSLLSGTCLGYFLRGKMYSLILWVENKYSSKSNNDNKYFSLDIDKVGVFYSNHFGREQNLDNIEHSVRMPYVFRKSGYQEWKANTVYYTLTIVVCDEIIYIFKGNESVNDCPAKLMNGWEYFDLDAQLQTAINTENYELANKIKNLLV